MNKSHTQLSFCYIAETLCLWKRELSRKFSTYINLFNSNINSYAKLQSEGGLMSQATSEVAVSDTNYTALYPLNIQNLPTVRNCCIPRSSSRSHSKIMSLCCCP